ncbi:hypothetical protein C8R44DRAFT_883691 [Mycena epipterygia]|nr:hypothetical protein C8R44DRAFT_883691 [Mycena epipterygia]
MKSSEAVLGYFLPPSSVIVATFRPPSSSRPSARVESVSPGVFFVCPSTFSLHWPRILGARCGRLLILPPTCLYAGSGQDAAGEVADVNSDGRRDGALYCKQDARVVSPFGPRALTPRRLCYPADFSRAATGLIMPRLVLSLHLDPLLFTNTSPRAGSPFLAGVYLSRRALIL